MTCAWSCKFSTCKGSFNERVSEKGMHTHQTSRSTNMRSLPEIKCRRVKPPSGHNHTQCVKKTNGKANLPLLKSAIALRQANSAGSTPNALNLPRASFSARKSPANYTIYTNLASTFQFRSPIFIP